MFKAKLIDNEKYYKFRRTQLILSIIGILAVPFIYTYSLPTWITLIGISIYVIAHVFIFKNVKLANSLIANNSLEFDDNEIRIISNKSKEKESILLKNIDKLTLLYNYKYDHENIKNTGQELIGKPSKNYIQIHQNDKIRKINFEIDSHYMSNQLNKIIESWTSNKINFEIINKDISN